MPYDWTDVNDFFNKKENADLLKGKLTKCQTDKRRNYVNFSFSQRHKYKSKDFRLRIVQDTAHVHWLDIYFESEGQKKGLRNIICPRLEDPRIHKTGNSQRNYSAGRAGLMADIEPGMVRG